MHPDAPSLEGYTGQEKSLKPDEWREQFTTKYGRRSLAVGIMLVFISELLAPVGLIEVGLILFSGLNPDPNGIITYLPIIAVGIQTTKVLHEGVHWAIFRYFGHAPKFQWGWLGGSVYISDEIIEQKHLLIVSLGPFILISPLALLAAILSPYWLAIIYFSTIFYWNTGGSMNDVTDAFYIANSPMGTRFWAIMDEEGLHNVWYLPGDEV